LAIIRNTSIHPFIKAFIKPPSKNLLRDAPSLATAIQIGLKQAAKSTFINFRQEADFQGERISRWRDKQWRIATGTTCKQILISYS